MMFEVVIVSFGEGRIEGMLFVGCLFSNDFCAWMLDLLDEITIWFLVIGRLMVLKIITHRPHYNLVYVYNHQLKFI
jgi:hypothetical protein